MESSCVRIGHICKLQLVFFCCRSQVGCRNNSMICSEVTGADWANYEFGTIQSGDPRRHEGMCVPMSSTCNFAWLRVDLCDQCCIHVVICVELWKGVSVGDHDRTSSINDQVSRDERTDSSPYLSYNINILKVASVVNRLLFLGSSL